MNSWTGIGRLTKDVEVRQTTSGMSVGKFTLAVDRPVKQGEERKADFINIVVFGTQAENCGRYLTKGSQCGITGRIQTGSYTRDDGTKVYTTDVIADRVEFLSKPEQKPREQQQQFAALNEEVPF